MDPKTAFVTVVGRTLNGLEIKPNGNDLVEVVITLPNGKCVIIRITSVTVINQRPIDPYPYMALTANGKIIASKECFYENVQVKIFGDCIVSVAEDPFTDL